MTFFQALYGSQYYEISQKGRDGNKGRLNGNLLLTAIIILFIVTVISVITTASSIISRSMADSLSDLPNIGGKNLGKMAAIILGLPIYLIVSNTVGSASRYEDITSSFMQLPDEEKQKANAKFLVPFFIMLAILMITVFI